MTRTLADVPDKITFVDEDGKPLKDWGELELGPIAKELVLAMSRRSRQSIDTTLERMVSRAIREFIGAAKLPKDLRHARPKQVQDG